MGIVGVRRQSHTDHPAPGEPRRRLNPRLAAGDAGKRVEALKELKEFHAAYREALQRLRSGQGPVVFPRGTYMLRVHLGVACAA